MSRATELLNMLEASGSKSLRFKLIRSEVVARQQEAECLVEVSVDSAKVEQAAQKSLKLKDVDEDGTLLSYETIHKVEMKNAEEELKHMKHYRDALDFNRATLELRLEESPYLKIRVLSNGKEITTADSATYHLSNTEVNDVEEPTYSIEIS